MDFQQVVEAISAVVDLAGVILIAGGIAWVTLTLVSRMRRDSGDDLYQSYRRAVGKVILLGLELLVAADIIRTRRHTADARGRRRPRDHRARSDRPERQPRGRAVWAMAMAARCRRAIHGQPSGRRPVTAQRLAE